MSLRVRSRAIVVLYLTLITCTRQPETERSFELRGPILAIRPNNELIVSVLAR